MTPNAELQERIGSQYITIREYVKSAPRKRDYMQTEQNAHICFFDVLVLFM